MFSIIIPLYNKRDYVARAIDSVLSQTYKEFEIIVVDDGSTDGGGDFVSKYFEAEIILIKQSNQGVSVARNTGVFASTQPFVAFLDADDYWSPNYLAQNAELIQKESDVKIIGSHYCYDMSKIEIATSKLKYRQIRTYFKEAIRNTLFTSSSTVLDRKFFAENVGFNPILRTGEDLDVWFRAVLSGGNVFFIENALVYYSTEDIQKGVFRVTEFDNRFMANIQSLYFQNGKPKYSHEFHTFLSKMIYSGLFNFYRYDDPDVLVQVNGILKGVTPRFLLADIYYKFPFLFKLDKLSRKYFKFIFRFIYN